MTIAILHLGGNINRLKETIRLAKLYPTSTIIVSSEDSIQEVVNRLKSAGINKERVILSSLAYDTCGNFTTTVKHVRSIKATKVKVVTDSFHMKRSMTLARTCYFGTGIQVEACPVQGSPNYKERLGLIIGGVIAVLLWRLTGIVYVERSLKKDRSKWWKQSQIDYQNVVW